MTDLQRPPRSRGRRSALLALLTNALLGACADAPELRIGIIEDRRRLPAAAQSGATPVSDTPMEDGVRVAIADALAADSLRVGGRRVRPVVRVRYVTTPEEAAAAAVALLNTDSVQVILSPVASRLSLPVAAVCDAGRVPLLSALSSAVALTEGRRWVFRVSAGNRQIAEATAWFAAHHFAARRVALLHDPTTSYTTELGIEYERALRTGPVRIVARGEIGPDLDEAQLEAVARRVIAARPDLVVLGAEAPERDRLLRHLLAHGATLPALGPDAWYATAPPSGAAAFRVGTEYRLDDSAAIGPRGRLTTMVQRRPSEAALWSYATATFLLSALQRARSLAPEDIRRALVDAPPFPSIVGLLDFRDDGTTAPRLYLYRAESSAGPPLDSLLPLPPPPSR